MGLESGGQKTEVRQEEFALVEFGTGEQTAAIIEQVEHGAGLFGMREPAVGRSIQLPEFANAVMLPAPHRRAHLFWRNRMGQPVGQGPAADLGAVELEVMQAQRFGRDQAVRARRGATEPFAEVVQHGLRPGRGMVAARVAGQPERSDGLGAGTWHKLHGRPFSNLSFAEVALE
jgi:hypothetical protein